MLPLGHKFDSTPGPWEIGICILPAPLPETINSGWQLSVALNAKAINPNDNTSARYTAADVAGAIDMFGKIWDDFAEYMSARMPVKTPKLTDGDRQDIEESLNEHGLFLVYLDTDHDNKITFFAANSEHGKPSPN